MTTDRSWTINMGGQRNTSATRVALFRRKADAIAEAKCRGVYPEARPERASMGAFWTLWVVEADPAYHPYPGNVLLTEQGGWVIRCDPGCRQVTVEGYSCPGHPMPREEWAAFNVALCGHRVQVATIPTSRRERQCYAGDVVIPTGEVYRWVCLCGARGDRYEQSRPAATRDGKRHTEHPITVHLDEPTDYDTAIAALVAHLATPRQSNNLEDPR